MATTSAQKSSAPAPAPAPAPAAPRATTPPLDPNADPISLMEDAAKKSGLMTAASMAANASIQGGSMVAGVVQTGLSIAGQVVGATSAASLEAVTGVSKLMKDGTKGTSDAFQKAN